MSRPDIMSEKKPKKEPKESKELKREGAASVADGSDEAVAGGSGSAGGADEAVADGSGDAGSASAEETPATEPAEQQEDADTRYMRLAADFQNFKKRTEKEKADIYAYANEKFAADLLEVIDNFERAIAQDGIAPGADEKFVEGMSMIMDQFVNVLEQNDIEEIPALGEDFDPNVHNAVQMMDSKDYESGKVMEVIQKGYKIKDKVLRPATVVVAQ